MRGDVEECGGGRFRWRTRGTGRLTQGLVELGHLGVVPACRLGLVAATKHKEKQTEEGVLKCLLRCLLILDTPPPAEQGVLVQNHSTGSALREKFNLSPSEVIQSFLLRLLAQGVSANKCA